MTDQPAKPRFSRRQIILVGAVIAVAVVWSFAWLFLSGLINDRLGVEIDKLADRGIVIDCNQRQVGGFPFRVEIGCANPRVDLLRTRTSGSIAGFRAVGLIYNPWHVIFEADAPLVATGNLGHRVEAKWTLLQSSVRILDRGMARGSLAADALDLVFRLPSETPLRFTASHFESHVRPSPAVSSGPGIDLDVSALALKFTLAAGDYTIGPKEMSLSVDATAHALPRPPYANAPLAARQWVANGGKLDLKTATLDFGTARIDASGILTPDETGTLSGRLRLVAHGLDKLGTGGVLGLPEEMSLLASGFMMFGKAEKQGDETVRVLQLVVDQGDVTLGRLPLGSLPPLF
ncbi:MAG: DUF2125 domain-containing protein [Hyphomicrobiaceae bacterium]|nr:DUF2125 domain-containing protein [Hyphomicrobiaceae bacterium]